MKNEEKTWLKCRECGHTFSIESDDTDMPKSCAHCAEELEVTSSEDTRYYKVDASSTEWCGFDTTYKFITKSAKDYTDNIWEIEYMMRDYISGYVDEDDEENCDDPTAVTMITNRITKEEFEDPYTGEWIGDYKDEQI